MPVPYQRRWFALSQWAVICAIPIAILSLQLLYVAPIARVGNIILGESQLLAGGAWGVFLRSSAFAVAATIIEVFGGFFTAVLLRQLVSRWFAKNVGLLLLPVLLGPVIVSFLFLRLPWRPSWLSDRPVLATWATVLAIEVWQYLPLCVCLFWLRLRFLPREKHEFARAHRWSTGELIGHLYWPHCRNLGSLLFLFVFIAAFGEFSKTEIILRSSAGTDTQFISHWLQRLYNVRAPIDPVFAKDSVLVYCGLFFVPTVICAAVAAIGFPWLGDKLTGLCASQKLRMLVPPVAGWWRWPKRSYAGISQVCSVLCGLGMIVLVLAPLLVLVRDISLPSARVLVLFVCSFLFALPVAVLVTVAAVASGIAARLAFPDRLRRLGRDNMLGLLALFVLRAVPAMGLAMCALAWFSVVSALGAGAIVAFWGMSQLVLVFPLIVVFVICIHCDVPLGELEFQSACRARLTEVALHSFLKRFALGYGLAFVFCFAFVWSEDASTRMLSHYISSATVELQMKVIGKGAEYGEAAALVLPSLALAIYATLVWSRWVSKSFDLGEVRNGEGHI